MRTDSAAGASRREFLAAGLATAGALALGRTARGAEAGDYGPFKMGLQSYSLRAFPLPQALARTQALGVGFWEAYPGHIPADLRKAAEVKAMAADMGIKVSGYGVVRLTKDLDAGRTLFTFAKALGVDYLSADPDPDSFDAVDKLVEEFDIAVGIHNHGPEDRKYGKVAAVLAAIKDHSPKIGACIDTGHYLRLREDPLMAVEAFDKRIFGVHLKDVRDAKTFTLLGEGDLRTADLLKALAGRQYRYCMALEYEENEKDPIADIRACLAATRKAAADLK